MNRGPDPIVAWEALFRAQVAVMRDLATDFPQDRISMTEYDVLFNLSRLPGQQARLKDLGGQLLITQPSVSRLVERLTADGLVEKYTPADDGRGTVVRLTDEGAAVYRRIGIEHARAIRRRFTGILSDDELRTLTDLCDRIRQGPTA